MYYLPVIINDNGLKTYMKTKDEKIFRLRPKRAELNMKIKELVSADNPDFDEIDRLYEKSITMLGFSAEKYDSLHQLLKKYKETHEGMSREEFVEIFSSDCMILNEYIPSPTIYKPPYRALSNTCMNTTPIYSYKDYIDLVSTEEELINENIPYDNPDKIVRAFLLSIMFFISVSVLILSLIKEL